MTEPNLSPELQEEYDDIVNELKWLKSDIKANIKRYNERKWKAEQVSEEKTARTRIRRAIKKFKTLSQRAQEILGDTRWLVAGYVHMEALTEFKTAMDEIYAARNEEPHTGESSESESESGRRRQNQDTEISELIKNLTSAFTELKRTTEDQQKYIDEKHKEQMEYLHKSLASTSRTEENTKPPPKPSKIYKYNPERLRRGMRLSEVEESSEEEQDRETKYRRRRRSIQRVTDTRYLDLPQPWNIAISEYDPRLDQYQCQAIFKPVFKGDHVQYFRWRENYISMIHNVPMRDTDKTTMLKHCLQGRAERLAGRVGAEYNSYAALIKDLEKTFGGVHKCFNLLARKISHFQWTDD